MVHHKQKSLVDVEGSCMDSSVRWSRRTAGTRGGHSCFRILHTENRTGEMVVKEHRAALFHLLPKMFCGSMILLDT